MTGKENLYKCEMGNKRSFPADSGIPQMMDKIIVYHDESLPEGLFPECQNCLTGEPGNYIKFDEKGKIYGHGKFKECAIKQIPMEDDTFTIEKLQEKFKNSKCPLCKKPIREIWFHRIPYKTGESVEMHHILGQRMKMVFGKWRLCQTNRRYDYTKCKIPNEIMEGTDYIEDLKELQKLMNTKSCPKCGRGIHAIELKLRFADDGAVKLLHGTYYNHVLEGNGIDCGFSECSINNDEFHDLLFS